MDQLNLRDPLFGTYVIAASLMILKVVGMSWFTVVRMMRLKSGFRSPEDLKKTILNPAPNPRQLEVNEPVERIRRIQMNDLENVPFCTSAGASFPFRAFSVSSVSRRAMSSSDSACAR